MTIRRAGYRSHGILTLLWLHNGHDGVSNHQPRHCLLNRLFRGRSKKTSKLRVTGLCAGNSPLTGEFPAQRASNAENVSIWWRHRDKIAPYLAHTGNVCSILSEYFGDKRPCYKEFPWYVLALIFSMVISILCFWHWSVISPGLSVISLVLG